MKNFKKLSGLFFLSLVTLSASFMSCSDDDDKPATLKFDAEKVGVEVGKTATVKVSGGAEPYTVTVMNKDLTKIMIASAEVEKDVITITGVAKGEAILNVLDANKNMGTLDITVRKEGIDFDKSELSLNVDEEGVVTILGGVAPYSADSQDTEVASAEVKDDKVTVKGLKVGETTINVTGIDKMNIGTITVTVK